LEQASGLDQRLFTNRKDQDAEEFFLQFHENGHCLFLTEESGSFSCSVYEARPEICRNYPSNPSQKALCDTNMAKFLSK
jgi:Fe-S-cluster containining protein